MCDIIWEMIIKFVIFTSFNPLKEDSSVWEMIKVNIDGEVSKRRGLEN